MTEIPGATKDAPIWMKFVKDDEGIKWGNVVVALILTAVSGYLASSSQRAGSNIDVESLVKMRIAAAQQQLGRKLVHVGNELYDAGCKLYDEARPL